MSKQNQGALSSINVQEKLTQGLATNKNNNRSRYVASSLPARGSVGGTSKATPATPYKNNHEKVSHSTLNSASNVSGVSVVAVLPKGSSELKSGRSAGASASAGVSASAGTKALNVATGQVKMTRSAKPTKDDLSVAVVSANAAPAAAAVPASASGAVSTVGAASAASSAVGAAIAAGAATAAAAGGLWASLAELKRKWGGMLWRTLWLFFPIFIGQLAATSMGVVDTVMAGAAGTIELSGVAIGSSIFWPSELFVVGLTLAIHPVIANLVGAKNLSLIPERMQIATVVCLAFSVLVGIVMVLIPFVYRLLPDVDAQMVSIGHGYLLAVGAAMPAYAMFNVLRTYWEGLGKTWPTLCFGCMALLLNIPLNYIFIFGHLGMPALGGMGCGVATALTMYLTVATMLLFVQKHKLFAAVRLYRRFYKVPVREYVTFAKYALPLGVAGMVETLCFSLVSLLLSPFGPVVVASHTIAMNVSGLLVIVPLALSSVASIEVGEAMGRNNWDLARRRAGSAVFLALSFYAFALLALLLGKELIASWYSNDVEVLALAPVLMLYCAVFLLPDTLQLMAGGILRGFKDTRTIFIITVVAYWVIGMPIGFGLGYGYISGALEGAYGFWLGFICSLSCASVLLILRARYLFKHKRAVLQA
ncbi:MAG TPA: MATE family efflux transporter [Candidatus Anaerobiospirillum pullistercoris]|uniref:MATE family efflux transporter n=1 Tax=Candidatus Anaerobiospirillum pullistercoris TaxID=2838452 RepID=A0A9D2B0L7_9GAMM|nr:MATE family efflux transporter [Candidatus Anaerobiospirillum pullistercoris]